jgi:DNA repair exonuclease SbcCD ATPase subunit
LLSNELSVNDRELSAASTDRLTMGHAISILKDSGIKAKIIKTFIPIINQLINKYLAALDFFVEFTLNESFEEKLLSRFRDEFSYESFSEGEKMRLNIAILFAWRALAKLRGSIDCNLVILDELLDSSLDNDGLDDVLKLLQNITSDENIFIISHKTDQLADKF